MFSAAVECEKLINYSMLFVAESDLSDSNKSDQASPPEQQSSGSEISTDRQFQPSESQSKASDSLSTGSAALRGLGLSDLREVDGMADLDSAPQNHRKKDKKRRKMG